MTSDPPGAEVLLYRYEPVDGVLTPREKRHLGATPLGPVPLPMGSYLCLLRKEGYRDTRYPVHITRERAWEGEIRLRTDEAIGEDFVYVPGGPFTYGEGKEAQTRELPDFAIARYPVTFAEYGETGHAFRTYIETLQSRARVARGELRRRPPPARARQGARKAPFRPAAGTYRELA